MSAHDARPDVRQESDALASRGVLVAIAIVVLAMIAGVVVAGQMVRSWQGALQVGGPEAAVRRAPREIGIVDQTPIATDHFGPRMRDAQRRRLARFGWVDRGAGIATIPIERAMELVIAGQGAPPVDAGSAP